MKYALKFVMLISIFALMTGRAAAGASEGDDAYRAGNYEKAIKEYKSCVSGEGDTGKLSCWCSFMLGKVLLDKKQYSEAITHLKRAVDIAPKAKCISYGWTPAWYFWLGKAYYETRQFKDAIVAFEKAATLSADKLEQQIPSLPNVSPEVRKYVLSMVPRKSSCYFWLGSTYYRNAQYQESVNALKQAIDLDPTAINFYIDLASSYRELKQYDNAMAAVKRSIEIKPSDYAYGILATIYTAQKQYDEAIGAYKKSIEINPKNADQYIRLAQIYDDKENYSEAVSTYNKALEIAPNNPVNPVLHFNLATAYWAMGRYDEVISITDRGLKVWTSTGTGLEQAISIENGYPVVKTIFKDARAQVFEYGPAKKADIQFGDKIIKIDGQSTKGEDIAKIIQRMFGHAGRQVTLTIERNGFKEPLTKVITQETYILKGGASFLALRSLAYREKGNLEYAFKDAEKAYSLDPNDRWAKSAMSIAYIDKGQYN
ncbi:MAG: tetratricopeptide repeat protein, partial [Proteobacteria bacterium]|nr:tetratricopeptide repeat protein [Pseudomonadota bacterium]